VIYFMQATDGGPVKIGHSADVPTRVRQLASHYRKPLAVLATMDGDREEEAEIHARFAHLRFGRTEQFRPASELMAFIGRPLLVGPNPETVEAMAPANFDPGTVPIKIDRKLASMAKAIATARGVAVAEYLSGLTSAPIHRDYAKMLRDVEQKGGAEGESKR
jgi:hypothetical protein